MGNNHDKFFSKNKRKILILGVENSGKSTLVQALREPTSSAAPAKQDLEIVDIKHQGLKLCFSDLGGSERQRIFWRQHFFGSQGVIYVIDVSDSTSIGLAIQELEKVVYDQDLEEMPIAVLANSVKNSQDIGQNIELLNKRIEIIKEKLEKDKCKKAISIFQGSTKDVGAIETTMIWLLKEMKPL